MNTTSQSFNLIELTLHKDSSKGYGFTVAGYCPCHVQNIIDNSIAGRAGLQQSDLIIKINNVNCQRATLKSVLSLIKNSTSDLFLTVNRPTGFNKSRNCSKLIAQSTSTVKKSKKTSYFGKLFRPSKWLSCAAPITMTKINSCSTIRSAHATNQTLNQTTYSKPSAKETSQDTGYDTLSAHDDSNDYTIETVTDTINSYSDCDLTVAQRSMKDFNIKVKVENTFNEERTQLIGDLIEMEANFVSFLSMSVATLARPLRGFFMQQKDYFTLFQNIEKILIISENFLRSMDKWSALDLYTRIGQLYTQKLSLFREAFTTYAKGHAKSKCLLNDLKSHSKQFRLFLNEAQSENMTLSNMMDLPLIHISQTLNYFKQIRRFTCESKRNPSEAPHIDSVIFELRKIINHSAINVESLEYEVFNSDNDESMETYEEACYDQDFSSNSNFMSTTINDETLMESRYRGSKQSLGTSSDESDLFYSTSS